MRQVLNKHNPDFNSLLNDKFLDWSKLNAFADGKMNVTQKLKFVFARVENFVGKGENAGYQHFLLFRQCSQKPYFEGSLKVWIVWERGEKKYWLPPFSPSFTFSLNFLHYLRNF